MPVYDQVKQALQDILAPELQALKAEIRRLDEKIESLRNEMNVKFSSLDERMESLRNEMNTRFSALERETGARFSALEESFAGLKHEVRTVLEIRERLAAVEAKVGITRP